jgi:hypothetical protein
LIVYGEVSIPDDIKKTIEQAQEDIISGAVTVPSSTESR